MVTPSRPDRQGGADAGEAVPRAAPFRLHAALSGRAAAKPGEVSLAHNGVLFLDELPEFSAQALDSLRAPLETGEVMVARANAHVRIPPGSSWSPR